MPIHRHVVLVVLSVIAFYSQRVLPVVSASNVTDELSSSLALKANPTAVLNLRNATESDQRCVTINDSTLTGQTLCTKIEANCSVEQAGYTLSDDNEEGLRPNGCNVSASINGLPCEKKFITFAEELYFVRVGLSCGAKLAIGDFNTGAGCSGDPPQICSKGSHRNYFRYKEATYNLYVNWKCSDEINFPKDVHLCTCLASLPTPVDDDVCSSCSVCKNEDYGAFALTCNGFSVDCNHSYTFSDKIPLYSSGSESIRRIQKPLSLFATLCFWALLPK